MDKFAITLISFLHIPQIGINNAIKNVTRVTILVGGYGPFSKDFPQGEDSIENINAWKMQQQQQVKMVAGV